MTACRLSRAARGPEGDMSPTVGGLLRYLGTEAPQHR
jgi:hypothetical protein